MLYRKWLTFSVLLLMAALLLWIPAAQAQEDGIAITIEGEVQSVDAGQIVVEDFTVNTAAVSITVSVGDTVVVEGVLTDDGTINAVVITVVLDGDALQQPTAEPTAQPTAEPTEEPILMTDDVCAYGQGYWKNHAGEWPVSTLTLGSQTYAQAELIAILNTPVRGDASVALAYQLIAAKLNQEAGVPGDAGGAIAEGDALLAAYDGKLPYGVAPSSADGQAMVNIGSTLDAYNNAVLNEDCESDEDDSIMVIEGPVEAIDGNVIYIYGIEITLDPNDPALVTIAIGDILRIEAGLEDDGLIVAIIVVIVIDLDEVELDDDDDIIIYTDDECSDPPPPWAPAHGWRAKCDPNYDGRGNSGNRGNGRGNNR